jgi:4-amino-4-deoxy-L-arabinose transferase-like glycosyltransferase
MLTTIPRRELWLVGGAMALSMAAVVVYAFATRPNGLEGDQQVYDFYGRYFTDGKFWWWTAPFGIPHASAWKAPGYPAWVGAAYTVLGTSTLRLALLQSLLAPLTVLLTWMLARRLFEPRVAVAAAFVVALFPFVWEFFGLLYPEALAIPLTLALLVVTLGRDPTPGRAAAVGALLGLNLLVRPTSFFLAAGIAAAWIVASGWRRGSVMTALTIAVAALVVLPWTIRNLVVFDGGFIPISIQDAAAVGTFNSVSANDPDAPYQWRVNVPAFQLEQDPEDPLNDAEVRSELQSRAIDYVEDHPLSVVKAFYWNGITRFWDVRRPSHSLDDAEFQGRSETLTVIGLGMHYLLLPLAIVGLWRARRRRELLWPVVWMAIAASLAFTIVASTRYRAPIEPLIVILAMSALIPFWDRLRRPGAAAPG